MRADDLLTLLEVARARSFVQAGIALEVDHSTISRRISNLERELGDQVIDRSRTGAHLTALGRAILPAAEQIARAIDYAEQAVRPDRTVAGHLRIASTEAFALRFVAPVAARLRNLHPAVSVDLITATRPLGQATGVDIEIGVGTSVSRRFEVAPLAEYALSLWVAPSYVEQHGMPTAENLAEHPIIYYVAALQRVDELDIAEANLPIDSVRIASTSVMAQYAATVAGGGVGLLPDFVVSPDSGLIRVVEDRVRLSKEIVALLPPRALRRTATGVFMGALVREVRARRHELMGETLPDPVPEEPAARGGGVRTRGRPGG
jgi:DNA-binding transcriptional LysR family regulator